jgi:hypothetical protein
MLVVSGWPRLSPEPRRVDATARVEPKGGWYDAAVPSDGLASVIRPAKERWVSVERQQRIGDGAIR